MSGIVPTPSAKRRESCMNFPPISSLRSAIQFSARQWQQIPNESTLKSLHIMGIHRL